MSALDFPVSPGQQTPANYYTTDSGVTYFWNGSEWTLYGSPGFMPMAGSSAAMSGHIVLSGDPASAMHPATKNYVDLATGGSQSFTGNITLTGELHGPASFIIDPAAIGDNTGTVIIKGNLQVDGDTTTINSATLTVDDKNIVLASGAADAAAANTAGITVDGANASLVYKSSGDKWVLNKVPYYNTARLLTTADEGTGNGLDADTVDGLEASAFSLTSHNHASTYLQLSGGTLSGNIGFSGTQTVDGYDISALGSKLAGIENSADVTDAANVGSAGAVMYADTDVTNMSFVLDEDNFSSNSNTKTATQQSIKAYVDVQTGVTNLSTAVAATSVTINSDTGTNATIAAVDGSNAGVMTNALFTKLSGIETGATADQTNAEIRAAIAAASDSNVFTDNEQTKLTGIASGAEVNVQSDWDATSGDAFIQNKPSLSFLLSAGGNLTGNLGINKVSPSSTLDIYNNTTNAAIHTLGPSTDTSYNYILSGSNDSGIRAVHFVNNSNKTSDGGADSYTIRNDGGALILGKSNQNTVLQGSTLKHGSDVILTASNIGTYASGAAHNHDSVYFKKTGGSLSGELSLSYDAPQIKLIDTGGSYYWLFNDDNEFRVRTNYGTGTSASGNDPLILINSSETGKLYNNAILTSANYNSYALPLTGGSISGNLTVDTNVLHVNTTDNRVGIGLINPASALEVSGVITLNNRIQLKEGTVDKAYIAWDANTDTLDLMNEATDEYLSIGSGLSGLGYTAESISYIVYHEGNLTLDTLGYAACRGWAPTYGNDDATNTITWSSIDDAVGLTVGNGGMAYKAIRMNNGEDLDIQVTFKGSAADTDGISFRLYFYQGDLPDGKTHVGESTSDSLVQEYSGGTSDKDTTWYEDDEIWADWANQGHIFTAPADGYVSLVVLNLTGFTGTIHVKEPQYQVYRPISDATNSSSSTQAASSTAVKAAYDIGNHNHPYLSNTTTFNTVIGTDSDIDTSGATIIDNLYMTDGVITSHGTRTLTLGDLGYTVSTTNTANALVQRDGDGDIGVGDIYCGDVYCGDVYASSTHEVWHAGNLTNVSQLTNNAGYVTSSGNTVIGTDSDIDTSGATIIDNLYMTDGVITSHGTRTLTLGDLGYTVSVSAGNDTIVKRHSSGYIFANYFNTTPNDVSSGVTKVCVETSNDGYIRHGTAGAIRTFLGIESGATADQTAAEILTAITTVDGSGSGLDADTLDGKHKIDFGATLATYGTTSGSSGRIRCTAPFTTNSGHMFQVTVSIYSGYTIHTYVVGGYMYSASNQWYGPSCVYTGGGSPNIVVGRDSNGKAYISIANGNYAGVRVHNMTQGYVTTVADTYDPWTITINAGTENSVTPAVYTTWHSGNDASLLRSDTSDTFTGTLSITGSINNLSTNGSSGALLGNLEVGYGGAYNSISARSNNSLHLNYNSSGTVYVGSSNTVWHSGNDGPGSGLDADKLDGLHLGTGRNDSANTVVRTDGSGYIQAGWINTTSGNGGTAVPVRIYASDDAYLRYYDLASFRTFMNVTAKTGYQGREQSNSDSNYWVGTMGWGNNDFNDVFHYGSGHIEGWSTPGNQPSTATSHWVGHQSLHYTSGVHAYGHQFLVGAGNPANCFLRGRWGTSFTSWAKMWNSANDGSGSGLDADNLDGYTWMTGGKDIRGTEIYADNWFHNYNAGEGLYNQATGCHFVSDTSDQWTIRDSGSTIRINFKTDGTTQRGSVYATSSNEIGFLDQGGNWTLRCLSSNSYSSTNFKPNSSNAYKLGSANYRWSHIYAQGWSQTSDRNKKQQIKELSEAEKNVAKSLKSLIRTYKFNDEVEKDGDDAKIRVGLIAQDLVAAFAAEGLDAEQYCMYEREIIHLDKDGREAEDPTESVSTTTELSVSYTEILAFIISVM